MAVRAQHAEPPDVRIREPHIMTPRGTFCISDSRPTVVLQDGDPTFKTEVSRFYSDAECEALEKLLAAKSMLRRIKGEAFWNKATETLADLMGAQYAFISRRMDVDEENTPLPPMGEPGSCLMGMSILYVDKEGDKQYWSNSKYLAYKSPCQHMKYDKVFLIPEKMSEVVPDNENPLPEQPEGYLAVPLSSVAPGQGPSFGHFGVMYTQKGLDERSLSYPFLEMLHHGLEDLILQAFEDQGLTMPVAMPTVQPSAVPRSDRISNSFKPYARSLSHELRTPMQGVVGMLDIMHATVQEATEGQFDMRARQSYASLRENIEVVQDSARRAVEAADNIVHAYDMNMTVPEVPETIPEQEELRIRPPLKVLLSPSATASPLRSHKRMRSATDVSSVPSKFARMTSSENKSTPGMSLYDFVNDSSTSISVTSDGTPSLEHQIAPGVRHMNVRESLGNLVNDMIKVGGRPESAIGQLIESGEEIEVRRKSANGSEHVRLVKWTVDEAVPETIMVDERDFVGLISRVLHNAFKFTEDGHIVVAMRLSPRGKYVLINVKDSGIGIPSTFIPNLFKPFSKEDDGITRSSEGLGLGLMVAKGLARRMNGDLYAVKSETEGPEKGTEFEMRIPLTPSETISRPGTPFSSPSPGSRLRSIEGSSERRLGKTPPVVQSQLSPPQPSPQFDKSRFTSPAFPSAPRSADNKNDNPTMLTPTSETHTIPSQLASAVHTPAVLQLVGCNLPVPNLKVSLASRLPLSFMVVEDNLLLRRILVHMLSKMGYDRIIEAYDGAEAIRQMEVHHKRFAAGEVDYQIDVVLMDLWMPTMNGYQTAERIFGGSADLIGAVSAAAFPTEGGSIKTLAPGWKRPVIVAVTADVTDEAIERVASSGMRGPLTKPYKQSDLERNLLEFCSPPASCYST